ncbi:MAG: hypothetical protein QOD26_4041, partial [Betaproteobacteria bacterium]|nr:hypothetical protein [Betaproteobacteria bacterium]
MHLISLYWSDERPSLQYRPDPLQPPIDYLELEAGMPLSISVGADRACTGYYDFVNRQKVPCPRHRHLGSKYAQCFLCQRQEVTYYAFTGIAADPEAAQTYLDTQPHQAYLNLFGRDLLKVGVVSAPRRLRRALEQGALASLFFAEANGSAIRELERYISRTFRVRERITTLEKVKRLAQSQSPERAEEIVCRAAERIAAELPPDLGAYLRPRPDFHYLQDHYHLRLDPDATTVHHIKQVEPGDTYAGMVTGMVGNLLILEAVDRRLYALPVKLLEGYLLSVEPELAPMRLQHEP